VTADRFDTARAEGKWVVLRALSEVEGGTVAPGGVSFHCIRLSRALLFQPGEVRPFNLGGLHLWTV